MLDRKLQLILSLMTVLFFIYIVNMVRNKKLELRYTLIWLATSTGLIIITEIPGVLTIISSIMHIKEPVNTLYLVIIFLLIMVVFSLSREMSRNYRRVNILIQELGIAKLEINELKKRIGDKDNC